MPCADRLEGYDEIVVDDLMQEIADGRVPHADAHQGSRDQLSLHASSNPEGKRIIQ